MNANEQHVGERLARIESSQTHLMNQMDRLIQVLDRLVRVEEHQAEQQRSIASHGRRIEAVETEIGSWRTFRKATTWIIGVVGMAGAAVMTFVTSGSSGQ